MGRSRSVVMSVVAFLGLCVTCYAQQASNDKSDDGEKLRWAFYGVLISAAVTLLTGLLSWLNSRRLLRETKRQNQAVLDEGRIAERRKIVQQALTEFYGPLNYYLNAMKSLYELFRAGKPAGFRTLTYLLDPDQEYDTDVGRKKLQLSRSDGGLLQEIIDTERKVEDLIMIKGGLADDRRLVLEYVPDPSVTDVKLEGLSLLAIAVTHFRLLRMARDGNFRGEVKRFKDFVYPRELDDVVEKRYMELHAELKHLTETKPQEDAAAT